MAPIMFSFPMSDFSDLSSTPTSSSSVSSSSKQLPPLMPLLVPSSVISSSSSGGSVLDAHLRLPELKAKLARLLEANPQGGSTTATSATAAADNLKRRLDIPAGLLDMVASHVIQEAEDEPYGLNGERG